MTMRNLAFGAAAATAALLLIVAAPSLLARGGAGGGRSGDTNGDNSADAPPPSNGPTPGQGGGIGTGPGDQGNGIDGDGRRDGAEQEHIARDAVDGMARADFRELRDERNRRSAEPVRGDDRR